MIDKKECQTSSEDSCIRAKAKAASFNPSCGRSSGLSEARECALPGDNVDGEDTSPRQGNTAWLLGLPRTDSKGEVLPTTLTLILLPFVASCQFVITFAGVGLSFLVAALPGGRAGGGLA